MTEDQLVEAMAFLIHSANLRRTDAENPLCGWEDTIGILTYYGVFRVEGLSIAELSNKIDTKTLELIEAKRLSKKPG